MITFQEQTSIFSKKHTSGGDYSIKIKYVGPDISSNRPNGPLGYLPDFEFTMADTSNNIWDPSCNPDQTGEKTAIILHDNPAQILVAMQQPTYVDSTLQWWDISNILFAGGPTFDLSVNGVNDYSSNSIDTVTGAYGGQNSNTRWIRTSYPIDMSTNDISLNYVEKSGKFITDQNGGVLAKPSPRVRFREFSEYGLKLQLLFWIQKPESRGKTVDIINTNIYKEFAKEKISIPYPKMEILMPK